MKNADGKLEWFNRNEDALALYRAMVDIAHIWDDLVDKDKLVTPEDINYAFTLCLTVVPGNKMYQQMFAQLQPLLVNACVGYMVANKYEKDQDEHGLEIGHTLRYSIAQMFVYLVTVLNGPAKALEILPEMMKSMIPERYADSLKEHHHVA